jgi:leader peptidase (prepilin peptidase)/N-methyltransferase
LVEFVTGLLFSFVFIKFGFGPFLPFYLLITAILVAMSVYDFMHKIIPDGMVFTFDSLALFYIFVRHSTTSVGFYDLFAGIVLFAFFGGIWLISSGKWMGFGDAKLSLGVGWMLGMASGIFSIMLAFWIGAIFSVFLLILERLNLSSKKFTIKSEIPFAPFIIFAFFVEFLLNWGSVYVGYLLNF